MTPIPVPPGLSYLPFQEDVIRFMRKRDSWRSILALEMGLGKSICVCGHINNVDPKHVLIVCPIYLMENWKRELTKWLVKPYEILIVNESAKSKKKYAKIKDNDYTIFLINYESLGKYDFSRIWDVLIADETVYIKSMKAARTQAFLKLKSHMEFHLNGTPITNKVKELFPSLFKLRKDICPTWYKFRERYCDLQLVNVAGRTVWWDDGATNLDELRDFMYKNKIMIRYKKEDVLKELPAKIIQPHYLVDTGFEDKTWYDMIKTMSKEEKMAFISSGGLEKSMSEDSLFAVRKRLGMAKVASSIEIIKDMLLEKPQVVVFCHHTEVANELYRQLIDYRPMLVTGENVADRQKNIDAFVKEPTNRIFIGTLGTTSVGLTIVNTDTCVVVEPPWSWSLLDQAISRLHRIGQLNTVLAKIMLVPDSIDSEIYDLIFEKKELLDVVIDGEGSKRIDGAL